MRNRQKNACGHPGGTGIRRKENGNHEIHQTHERGNAGKKGSRRGNTNGHCTRGDCWKKRPCLAKTLTQRRQASKAQTEDIRVRRLAKAVNPDYSSGWVEHGSPSAMVRCANAAITANGFLMGFTPSVTHHFPRALASRTLQSSILCPIFSCLSWFSPRVCVLLPLIFLPGARLLVGQRDSAPGQSRKAALPDRG